MILIAEDEEINYIYLETLLLDEMQVDCKTFHARNGQEAIDICEKKSGYKYSIDRYKNDGYEWIRSNTAIKGNVPQFTGSCPNSLFYGRRQEKGILCQPY